MSILDAFIVTGMATATQPDGSGYDGWYAKKGDDGKLAWFVVSSGKRACTVSYTAMFENDWKPYHPKPTKCSACIEADGLETAQQIIHNINVTMPRVNHLRKYHCTCKREK